MPYSKQKTEQLVKVMSELATKENVTAKEINTFRKVTKHLINYKNISEDSADPSVQDETETSKRTYLHHLVLLNRIKEGVNNERIRKLLPLNLINIKDGQGLTALQCLMNQLIEKQCTMSSLKSTLNILLTDTNIDLSVTDTKQSKGSILHLLVLNHEINEVEKLLKLNKKNERLVHLVDGSGHHPLESLMNQFALGQCADKEFKKMAAVLIKYSADFPRTLNQFLHNNPKIAIETREKLTQIEKKLNPSETQPLPTPSTPTTVVRFSSEKNLKPKRGSIKPLPRKNSTPHNLNTTVEQLPLSTQTSTKSISEDLSLHNIETITLTQPIATNPSKGEGENIKTTLTSSLPPQNTQSKKERITSSQEVQKLRDSISALNKHGQFLQDEEKSSKADVLIKLAKQLTEKLDTFLDTLSETTDVAAFKKDFLSTLNNKKTCEELGEYRVNLGTIFANIGIALTGVGALIIAAYMIYAAVTIGRPLCLFQSVKTTSEEKAEDIEHKLASVPAA